MLLNCKLSFFLSLDKHNGGAIEENNELEENKIIS